MRFLIVDDDATCRATLGNMLQNFAQCDFAIDGEQALLLLLLPSTEPAYDAVFLDIMLPKIDGHSVLREIREHERELGRTAEDALKIIITSSLENYENVLLAFQNGCESYIAKPFSKSQVITEIARLGLIPNGCDNLPDRESHNVSRHLGQ